MKLFKTLISLVKRQGKVAELIGRYTYSTTSATSFFSRQASHQLESIQEQLHHVASQRDNAVLQLASAQEQAQQYAVALNNLQMVLEQFQRG